MPFVILIFLFFRAFRSGKLTAPQAAEIASAASVAPQTQDELLAVAQAEGLAGLRDKCRKVIAQATPDEAERDQRLHAARYVRTWTQSDGAFRLDARLTPEAGANLRTALDRERERLFASARRQGRTEPYRALDADALVALATRTTPDTATSGPKALVNVRVDRSALKRGHAEPGEVCEIPGVGPISVASARSYLGDCFFKLIVCRGSDVLAISRMSRTIPAALAGALDERDRECVVQGCRETKGLERDHVVGVEQGGPTSMDNLAKLCKHHHRLKTYKGFRLEREGQNWKLVPGKKYPARAGP